MNNKLWLPLFAVLAFATGCDKKDDSAKSDEGSQTAALHEDADTANEDANAAPEEKSEEAAPDEDADEAKPDAADAGDDGAAESEDS